MALDVPPASHRDWGARCSPWRARSRQRDGQDEDDEADVVGRDDLADHADGVDLDADIDVACVSSIWVKIRLPPISVPTR
jgi:hypothetical protein